MKTFVIEISVSMYETHVYAINELSLELAKIKAVRDLEENGNIEKEYLDTLNFRNVCEVDPNRRGILYHLGFQG